MGGPTHKHGAAAGSTTSCSSQRSLRRRPTRPRTRRHACHGRPNLPLRTCRASSPLPQGDLEAALASLAPLPDLQELSLYKNKLTGRVGGGGALCDLAQARGSALCGSGIPNQTCGGVWPCCATPGPAAVVYSFFAWLQGGLESLQLGGMGLAGSVPPCLFDADSTLYQFSAANNQLEGTIPDAFGATIRLQLLNVGSNRLGGSLPPTLAGLASLQILDVTANNLTGAPRWLLRVPCGARRLQLGGCFVAHAHPADPPCPPAAPAGELPPFSASKDLTALYASQNAFSGALPDGLAAHPSLRTLELGDNQLSGLPARWGQAPGAAVDMPLRYLRWGWPEGPRYAAAGTLAVPAAVPGLGLPHRRPASTQ